eukprot:5156164-Lingulodinium_polyedra.AAC.1
MPAVFLGPRRQQGRGEGGARGAGRVSNSGARRSDSRSVSSQFPSKPPRRQPPPTSHAARGAAGH